jgi:hypothetical protein
MFFVLSVNVSERFFAATPGVSFEDDDDDDDESEDESEDESDDDPPKEKPSRRGRVNAAALETT